MDEHSKAILLCNFLKHNHRMVPKVEGLVVNHVTDAARMRNEMTNEPKEGFRKD